MEMLALLASEMHSSSPIQQFGWRVGRRSTHFPAAVHRNFLRQGPSAPRPAICTRSGLWLLRYEQTPLGSAFRFAHSRQVLTGRAPFSGTAKFEEKYMVGGKRPPQPDCPKIPDPLWRIVERCWHETPSERMSAGEALNGLEAESRRITDSSERSSI